jgi:ATP-binding cassette, subfamily F, member 3
VAEKLALLSLNNISKSYGDNVVIDGVSLQVHGGEKVGLVGPNGAGKTTLLKIILKMEEPDDGQVVLSRGVFPAYLSQKAEYLPGMSLEEFLYISVSEILALRDQLAEVERDMASCKPGEDLSDLMGKYEKLTQVYESRGGYSLDNRIKTITGGMGFSWEDLKRPLTEFSGGEKTRAQLSALLLGEPDLLLLDEPTNHLDMDAVEWLEGYLRDWRGALLVVSHDRYFLDRVVGRIAALESKKLKAYRGNYSSYMHQKKMEDETQQKAYKKQQAAVQKDMDLIRTSTAGERAKRQARSREKRLEKLDLIAKPGSSKAMSLNFGYGGRSSRIVVAFDGVAKYFGEMKLFGGVTFEIYWGDRVAIVGPNGAGKTTLLRIITGEELADQGKIKVGPSVRTAYFDQEQEQLNPESTPLETIVEEAGLKEQEARKYLGRYLFRGDEAFKKVGDLSGGEKSRLALARVALTDGNFLVLDEPTNHLDIKGVEELEASLEEYPGTLLVVSHDRYFIDRTATKILEVRDGRVSLYKGGYAEYMEDKARQQQEEPPATENGIPSRREQREKEREKRDKILALRRERRQMEKRVKELEEAIRLEEERLSRLEQEMATPGFYDQYEEARQLTAEFDAARENLQALYGEWEEAGLDLEKLPEEEE